LVASLKLLTWAPLARVVKAAVSRYSSNGLSTKRLSEVFRDIEELFPACRFRDCAHDREPGCAVQSAIASGELEERRWLSYRKMERELASLHRRQSVADQRHHAKSFHQLARDAAMAKDYRNRFKES